MKSWVLANPARNASTEHGTMRFRTTVGLLICAGCILLTAYLVPDRPKSETVKDKYTEVVTGSLKTLSQSNARAQFKPMDNKHSPDSTAWDNTFAVCAIMKDENVTDVTEWLQYYQWLGVDHVFLADNNSEDKSVLAKLSKTFSPSFLTTYNEPQPKAQMKVYKWCLQSQRSKFNWIAFFDLDEFQVIRKAPPRSPSPPTLKSFMNSYRYKPGLSVHWVFVGPSGLKTRPLEGGVLKHYDQCITKVDHRIKTIVNTWFFAGMAEHPHNFLYRGFGHSVLEDFSQVALDWRPKPLKKGQWSKARCQRLGAKASRSPAGFHDHCKQWPAAAAPAATADYVALFHYASKSEEDFRAKQLRGSGLSGHTKGMEYLEHLKQNQQHAPLCSELKAIHPLCCRSPESDALPEAFPAEESAMASAAFSSAAELQRQQEEKEAVVLEAAPSIPTADSSSSSSAPVLLRSTHLHSTIIQGSSPSSESLDALLMSVALLTVTVSLLAALVLWRGRR